jgi:hypothetical protein
MVRIFPSFEGVLVLKRIFGFSAILYWYLCDSAYFVEYRFSANI